MLQTLATLLLPPLVLLVLLYLRHAYQAHKIGLPWLFLPLPEGLLYFLLISARPVVWVLESRMVPGGVRDRLDMTGFQRRWRAKHRVHAREGDVLNFVSWWDCSIVVADREVARQVLANHKGWVKPEENYGMCIPDRLLRACVRACVRALDGLMSWWAGLGWAGMGCMGTRTGKGTVNYGSIWHGMARVMESSGYLDWADYMVVVGV